MLQALKGALDRYVYWTYCDQGMDRADLAPVEKQLQKLPEFIVTKLRKWAEQVELHGINEIRKIPGFHDEPLKRIRYGQRSIRLSKGYRAIYRELADKSVRIIRVEEVNKHEY
jgi:proteic killer suppression protein